MWLKSSILSMLIFVVFSCARQGSPSGGPKDETPPAYLSSTPDTLSLNVPINLNEIKINFDEFVVLKDYQNNVVASPSLGNSAVFLPVGSAAKSVKIKLSEPLKENTTYNINFGNSIQDNNEGNKLSGFQFVFSTGNFIDSLNITGTLSVLGERKLPKSPVVGLFPLNADYKDSLILKQKPFYVAKPDDSGAFKLNYLSPGKYQLIAFDDEVQNMNFDPNKEKVGFIDHPVDLSSDQKIDVILFSQRQKYRAIRVQQKGYGHLVFNFEGQPENVEIEPLDFDFKTSGISWKPRTDSLNFWFKPAIDSIDGKSKRINFLVKHNNSNDTLSVVYNNLNHLLKLESKSKLDVAPGRKLKLTANYPVKELDSELVKVFRDSIELKVKLLSDPKNENDFIVDFPVELNSKYKIIFLPNAINDYFDKTNDTIKYNFNTKTKSDYGNLKLTLSNPPNHPFFLKLYSEKDVLFDEQYTKETVFEYNYLAPGNYYFQILVDENENGIWDTGDFFSRKHPEPALVFPGLINVRSMWDAEETWLLK